jgi:hypothetical protein
VEPRQVPPSQDSVHLEEEKAFAQDCPDAHAASRRHAAHGMMQK